MKTKEKMRIALYGNKNIGIEFKIVIPSYNSSVVQLTDKHLGQSSLNFSPHWASIHWVLLFPYFAAIHPFLVMFTCFEILT